MARTPNAHGPWDAPLYTDWLAWLTLAALIAAIPETHGNPIDAAFAFAFQLVLFGVIPGQIRRAVRHRRQRRQEGA